MKNETPNPICPLCCEDEAILFVVMRQGDYVEKAHICKLCFCALQMLDEFTTEKVPLPEFQATFTTRQLQVN